MKTLTAIELVLLLCAVPGLAQTESELRDTIVGTWKLVSAEETLKDGTTRPMAAYGPHGKGFLMYQRDGYMCADLVNPDRPKWADPAHTTPEEKAAAADGSFAYCGRYEIDVKQRQLVHLPEVATDPGYVGSRQIRQYTFESGRLILGDIEKDDPEIARWRIVWEKVLGVAELTGQHSASIVGTWKVVRYEDRGADGTVSYPYGENPAGYFVYDATGHLSVHIMRTPALASFPGMREGSADGASYREAFLAYAAYFGTYSVDAAKGTVTHHVEGSLRPDYTGTDQVRPFRIEGDRLIIEIRQDQQYLRRELIRVK